MHKQEKIDTIDQENIDYMHPYGKPTTLKAVNKTEEELVAEQKSVRKSIDEADGHHLCSAACQKRHRL